LRIFRHYIYELPKILVVVLGREEEAETFVQRADKLAGQPADPRWVIWARRPDQVQEVLEEHQGAGELLQQLDGARGYSLSLSDEVADVITQADGVPSMTRVFRLYARAEALHHD